MSTHEIQDEYNFNNDIQNDISSQQETDQVLLNNDSHDDDISFGSLSQASSVTATSVSLHKTIQEQPQQQQGPSSTLIGGGEEEEAPEILQEERDSAPPRGQDLRRGDVYDIPHDALVMENNEGMIDQNLLVGNINEQGCLVCDENGVNDDQNTLLDHEDKGVDLKQETNGFDTIAKVSVNEDQLNDEFQKCFTIDGNSYKKDEIDVNNNKQVIPMSELITVAKSTSVGGKDNADVYVDDDGDDDFGDFDEMPLSKQEQENEIDNMEVIPESELVTVAEVASSNEKDHADADDDDFGDFDEMPLSKQEQGNEIDNKEVTPESELVTVAEVASSNEKDNADADDDDLGDFDEMSLSKQEQENEIDNKEVIPESELITVAEVASVSERENTDADDDDFGDFDEMPLSKQEQENEIDNKEVIPESELITVAEVAFSNERENTDADDDDFGDFDEMPLSKEEQENEIDNKEVIPESELITVAEAASVSERENTDADELDNNDVIPESERITTVAEVATIGETDDAHSDDDEDGFGDFDEMPLSKEEQKDEIDKETVIPDSERITTVAEAVSVSERDNADVDDDDFGDLDEMPLSKEEQTDEIDKESVIPESVVNYEKDDPEDDDDEFGDFGDFEGSERPQNSRVESDKETSDKNIGTCSSEGAASNDEQKIYSNFVKRTTSIFHSIFYSQDISPVKRSGPLNVDLNASTLILSALSEFPGEEQYSSSLGKLQSTHLEQLFDYTTKEDNPSNVIIGEMFQFKFPENFDEQMGKSPPCYFSFGKISNVGSLNQHRSISVVGETSNISADENGDTDDLLTGKFNDAAFVQDREGMIAFHDKVECEGTVNSFANPTVVKIPQKKPKKQMEKTLHGDGISSSNCDVASGFPLNGVVDSTQTHASISSEKFESDEFGQFHEPPAEINTIPDDPFGNEVLSAVPLTVVDPAKEQLNCNNNENCGDAGENFKIDKGQMFPTTTADFQAFRNGNHDVPGSQSCGIQQTDAPISATLERHSDDFDDEFEDDEFGQFHEPPAEINTVPDDPFGSEVLSAIPLAVVDQAKEQLNCNNNENCEDAGENFKIDEAQMFPTTTADFQAFRNGNHDVPGSQSCGIQQTDAPISATLERHSDDFDDEFEDDEFGQFHEPPVEIRPESNDPFDAIPFLVVDQAKERLNTDNKDNVDDAGENCKIGRVEPFPQIPGNVSDVFPGVQSSVISANTQPDAPMSSRSCIVKDRDDDQFEDDEFGQFHEPPTEIRPEPDCPIGSEVLSIASLTAVDQTEEDLRRDYKSNGDETRATGITTSENIYNDPCHNTENSRGDELDFGMDVSKRVNSLGDDVIHETSEFNLVDSDYNQSKTNGLVPGHHNDHHNQYQVSSNVESDRVHALTVIGDPANISTNEIGTDGLNDMTFVEIQQERAMKQVNHSDVVLDEHGKIREKKMQSSSSEISMRSNDIAHSSQQDDGISTSSDNVWPELSLNEQTNVDIDANEKEQDSDIDFGEFEAPPEDKSNIELGELDGPKAEEFSIENGNMVFDETRICNNLGYKGGPTVPICGHVDGFTTLQVDGNLPKPSLISELFSPVGGEMHLPSSESTILEQYPYASEKVNPVSVYSDDTPRNHDKFGPTHEDNVGPALSLQGQNHTSNNHSGCESDDDSFGDFCDPTH